MNTTNTTEYLLLFRGEGWDKGLSTEQLRETMEKVNAWFESLKERGILKSGRPLEREGTIVSGPGARVVLDGPFAESKEVIGGYLMIEAADMDAAVAIAKGCPTLKYATSVEVRPLADECPTFKRVSARLEMAVA